MSNISDTLTKKIKSVAEKIEPWQWVAGIVVLGVGLVTYIKNKSKPQTETLVENPVLGAGSSGGGGGSVTSAAEQINELKDQISGVLDTNNSKIADAFSKQGDLLTAANDKISTLSDAYTDLYANYNKITSRQDNTNSVISKTTETLTTLTDKINSGNTGGSANTIDTDLQKKIDASQQISVLGKTWTDLANKFKSDGSISDAERAQLKTIHDQADQIGFTAGLQSTPTTVDGSERKLVTK